MKGIRHTLFFIVFALVTLPWLGGCGLGGGARPYQAVDAQPREVELFFVTNRAPDASDGLYFGGARGDLSYGISTIGIPPGHVMGRHEEPSLLRLQTSHDEQKHISLKHVLSLTREEFAERLGKAIEADADGKLMIFVHGYNEEFPAVSKRVAQFASDLKFSGPVVLYSWPSQGSLTAYTVDETNAEWAQADFVRLMGELLDYVPVRNIYLIGHSMGNRIIGRAMTSLASDRLESDMLLFREIIMIAPDIDAEVFRIDMAPRLARTGIHVTLYASSNDRALLASKAFHGYPRAGESGSGLIVVDGVETIDASEVSGGLLGHSYFAEDRRIIEDIFALLQTGQRADRRFGLQAVNSPLGRHWTLRK
ncbi:MAG: alpha/beta fold hydrolase [Gammaproteobacteria bacterium]|jgi:esterase/lipase superfamily enzyme